MEPAGAHSTCICQHFDVSAAVEDNYKTARLYYRRTTQVEGSVPKSAVTLVSSPSTHCNNNGFQVTKGVAGPHSLERLLQAARAPRPYLKYLPVWIYFVLY